ncbi:MAG: cation transporter [Oligoflexia bacterium]|nr:cation transporter [Oligoflexia bacterium]
MKGPSDWTRRVIRLSWFTIFYNLLEGLVSIGFGVEDESIALAGFGGDSLIEVASAFFVLWRFRGEAGLGHGLSLSRERSATRGIGGLFLVLGFLTAAISLSNLYRGVRPETTLPGIVISCISLSFMFALWRAKKAAALMLDSRTVAQDAACSLACIQLSFVLLAGSAVYQFAPGLGWVDAVAALVISGFILREGVEAVRSANRPEFNGGCCGCSCE